MRKTLSEGLPRSLLCALDHAGAMLVCLRATLPYLGLALTTVARLRPCPYVLQYVKKWIQ